MFNWVRNLNAMVPTETIKGNKVKPSFKSARKTKKEREQKSVWVSEWEQTGERLAWPWRENQGLRLRDLRNRNPRWSCLCPQSYTRITAERLQCLLLQFLLLSQTKQPLYILHKFKINFWHILSKNSIYNFNVIIYNIYYYQTNFRKLNLYI